VLDLGNCLAKPGPSKLALSKLALSNFACRSRSFEMWTRCYLVARLSRAYLAERIIRRGSDNPYTATDNPKHTRI